MLVTLDKRRCLLTSPLEKARTGLLRGKHTEPVDRTATAGFITLSVAPYGYTKVRALIVTQTVFTLDDNVLSDHNVLP